MKNCARGVKYPDRVLPEEELQRGNRTIEPLNLANEEAFQFYIKHRTNMSSEKAYKSSLHTELVIAMFEAIGRLMAEYEGGVMLKKFGYFQSTVIPYKYGVFNPGEEEHHHFFHTDGYIYTPMFYSDTTTNSCMRGFIMDRTFYAEVKTNLRHAFEKQFRPKLYYRLMKSLHDYKTRK